MTTTTNKAVIIAEDTNIDLNKSPTKLEKYKEVIGTYNLNNMLQKQHVQMPRSLMILLVTSKQN